MYRDEEITVRFGLIDSDTKSLNYVVYNPF